MSIDVVGGPIPTNPPGPEKSPTDAWKILHRSLVLGDGRRRRTSDRQTHLALLAGAAPLTSSPALLRLPLRWSSCDAPPCPVASSRATPRAPPRCCAAKITPVRSLAREPSRASISLLLLVRRPSLPCCWSLCYGSCHALLLRRQDLRDSDVRLFSDSESWSSPWTIPASFRHFPSGVLVLPPVCLSAHQIS